MKEVKQELLLFGVCLLMGEGREEEGGNGFLTSQNTPKYGRGAAWET